MPYYLKTKVPFLIPPVQFPHPECSTPEGIVAFGGDLSVHTLLKAYSAGIFPWFSEEDEFPIWWSPPERMVLIPGQHYLSRSMKKIVANGSFTLSLDTCFEKVMERCAQVFRPGQGGTWITPDMQTAYTALHHAGYAHSVEVWQNNELVGGLYGVCIGAYFCGESMFSLVSNASKYAFIELSLFLEKQGFMLLDCQNYTPHLASLGAKLMDRKSFLEQLQQAITPPHKKENWLISR